ncbi:phospholipase [Salmonella enterica subsp. enterica serovar Heidelberg]|nr:cardiolipin synthase 2 [Salmonella enterica subsp. enterica serovar Montevideo str. 609460]SQJ29106.1 phospholipase [Salmonella enterica subsp. enterica serovar Heidelberg]VEB47080.1 phospholipase [Salmonella enterica subsp. enterica serovar Havana]
MKCGWREGNQIQLLENGDQFYPAVFEAIAQAQQKNHSGNLYLV